MFLAISSLALKRLVVFAPGLILAGTVAGSVTGQSRDWRRYVIPDTAISLKLPAPLKRVKSFDAEHGVGSDPEQDHADVTSYISVIGNSTVTRFAVLTIGPAATQKYAALKKSNDALFRLLALTFIADDDESQLLHPPTNFRGSNITGTEYVFVNDDKVNGGRRPIYSRGRIFIAADRAILLIFIGQSAKDLRSVQTDDFFNSVTIVNPKKMTKSKSSIKSKPKQSLFPNTATSRNR